MSAGDVHVVEEVVEYTDSTNGGGGEKGCEEEHVAGDWECGKSSNMSGGEGLQLWAARNMVDAVGAWLTTQRAR